MEVRINRKRTYWWWRNVNHWTITCDNWFPLFYFITWLIYNTYLLFHFNSLAKNDQLVPSKRYYHLIFGEIDRERYVGHSTFYHGACRIGYRADQLVRYNAAIYTGYKRPLKIGCPCRAGSIYYSLLKTHDIIEKNIMLIIIRQIWEMIKIPVMDLSQPTAIKSTVLSSPRIKKKRETSSSKKRYRGITRCFMWKMFLVHLFGVM